MARFSASEHDLKSTRSGRSFHKRAATFTPVNRGKCLYREKLYGIASVADFAHRLITCTFIRKTGRIGSRRFEVNNAARIRSRLHGAVVPNHNRRRLDQES